ncbi:MAG: hypothetical protein V1933_03190 [Candidatus Omnitrophota bacterium]
MCQDIVVCGVSLRFSINVMVLDSSVLLFFEQRREDKSAASLEQYLLSISCLTSYNPKSI